MKDVGLFTGDAGSIISGIENLAQRMCIILNTKVTDPLRELEGCSLLDYIGKSQADTAYISMILSSVISEVIELMTPGNSELPDDEALNTAYVSNVSLNVDTVNFDLVVVSRSGDQHTLPISLGGSL